MNRIFDWLKKIWNLRDELEDILQLILSHADAIIELRQRHDQAIAEIKESYRTEIESIQKRLADSEIERTAVYELLTENENLKSRAGAASSLSEQIQDSIDNEGLI